MKLLFKPLDEIARIIKGSAKPPATCFNICSAINDESVVGQNLDEITAMIISPKTLVHCKFEKDLGIHLTAIKDESTGKDIIIIDEIVSGGPASKFEMLSINDIVAAINGLWLAAKT